MSRSCVHGRFLFATAAVLTLIVIYAAPIFARQPCRIKRPHKIHCGQCVASEGIAPTVAEACVATKSTEDAEESLASRAEICMLGFVETGLVTLFDIVAQIQDIGAQIQDLYERCMAQHTADPQHSMLVRVVDPEGKPIAGAWVTPERITLSDENLHLGEEKRRKRLALAYDAHGRRRNCAVGAAGIKRLRHRSLHRGARVLCCVSLVGQGAREADPVRVYDQARTRPSNWGPRVR